MSSINAHNSVVRSASSLQRRFLLGAGLGGTALILVLAWGADLALDRFMRRETEVRLGGAAQRAQLLVDQSLADRERQVEVLALNPAVVDGVAERVTDAGRIAAFLDAVNAKYDSDLAVDFLDPEVNGSYAVRPGTVIALTHGDFTGSPTRWRFPSGK